MLLARGRAAPVPPVPPALGHFGLFLYSEIKPEPCQSVRAGSALRGPSLSLSPAASGILCPGIFPNPQSTQDLLPGATGPPSSPGPEATCLPAPGTVPECHVCWKTWGEFSTRLHFPGSCCPCQCQLCALQLWATERSPCCTLSCAEGGCASCCHLHGRSRSWVPTPHSLFLILSYFQEARG